MPSASDVGGEAEGSPPDGDDVAERADPTGEDEVSTADDDESAEVAAERPADLDERAPDREPTASSEQPQLPESEGADNPMLDGSEDAPEVIGDDAEETDTGTSMECPAASDLEVTFDGVASGLVQIESGGAAHADWVQLQIRDTETPSTEDDDLDYSGHIVELYFADVHGRQLPFTVPASEIEVRWKTIPTGATGLSLGASNLPRTSLHQPSTLLDGSFSLIAGGEEPGDQMCGMADFSMEFVDPDGVQHALDVSLRFNTVVQSEPEVG